MVSVDLQRVGGEGDGGYLLPDILDDVDFCFSPGVEYRAEFEKQLATSHGIKCFMADASVDAPPLTDDNFEFDKKFLGNRDVGQFITLKTWMDQKVGEDRDNLLLQMDIEGGEYGVLITESMETLRRFSCIVIEFHMLHKLLDSYFFLFFSSVMEKLFREFSICHVHPNNCCGSIALEGLELPRVIEVTFLRKDLAKALNNGKQIVLPHPLDRKNVDKNDDLLMPRMWWAKPGA